MKSTGGEFILILDSVTPVLSRPLSPGFPEALRLGQSDFLTWVLRITTALETVGAMATVLEKMTEMWHLRRSQLRGEVQTF